MPLSNLIQSLSGICRYCGQNAGFLRKQHGQCRDLHASGYQEMVQLAAQAAAAHTFNEAAPARPSRTSPSAPEQPGRTSTASWRRASSRESPRQ